MISFFVYQLHLQSNIYYSATVTISSSILHIANQCRNSGVKDDFIWSLTYSRLTTSELINDVNNAIRNKCQTSGYQFFDNDNVITDKLWKNILHLRNSGKDNILSKPLLSLSTYFVTKQQNHQIFSYF